MSAQVKHKVYGLLLREGGAWVAALCDGDSNPAPADGARDNYTIHQEEEGH